MPHASPGLARPLPVRFILIAGVLLFVVGMLPAAAAQESLTKTGYVGATGTLADAAALGLDRPTSDTAQLESATSAEVVPGELLVTYRAATDLSFLTTNTWSAAMNAGAEQPTVLSDQVVLVRSAPADTEAVTVALRLDTAVASIEPNMRRHWAAVPNDTSYPLQWAHQQTNAEAAWDRFTGTGTDTGPLIAILDSGVDATHPDLTDVVVGSFRSANGQIFSGEQDNDPCGIGHGTSVAGAAAAAGNNGYGVSGALWGARIIDVALTSTQNNCPSGPADSDTIAAMNYVTGLDEQPLVMNMSLGASQTSCSAAYQSAVNQARANGIVVVAAAGNDGTDSTSIPASCDGVISVGATGPTAERADYSQANPQVDIAAPGGFLGPLSACPTFEELAASFVLTTSREASDESIGGCPAYTDPNGQRLRGISGTSFAAPYVAAAIGMLRQYGADQGAPVSVDQAEAILEATARDLGTEGRDCDYGWGILDLDAMTLAVGNGDRPALEPDTPIGSGSCDNAGPSGPLTEFEVNRISASDTSATDPITQAVAISRSLPDSRARHAVLARVDDFADALAGSAVGLGVGPLLFTSNTGPLAGATETELLRVLDFSGAQPTVYIMGGVNAIPAGVDPRLVELGIRAVRIAGDGREATAVQAAMEVERLSAGATFTTRDYVFVAYGRGFPDAVGAGQMAAHYGIPVLLTNTDGPLHPQTRAELQRLTPEKVYVLGGTAVISDDVMNDIEDLGFDVSRLAGGSRVDTALEVARLYLTELQADVEAGAQVAKPGVVAVNLRNNFNDVLAASLIGGNGNLFLPLEGDDGAIITQAVRRAFCEFGGPLFVVGGFDVITSGSATDVAGVLGGSAC